MLYRIAVCLVALMITLLFTTSKAEFEIERGKDAVKQLLSRFIFTALNNECTDLRGLISTANRLVSDEKLKPYLSQIALDSNTCHIMLSKINRYEQKFEEILDAAGIQLLKNPSETEIQYEQDHIPMFEKLTNLRSLCESPPTTSEMVATTSSGTGTSLRVLLRTEPDSNKVSEFQINEGIKEVRVMLDALLQLAFDINCDNLESLLNFADSMVDDTELYKAVLKAVSQHSSTIIENIRDYRVEFYHVLMDSSVEDSTILPMKGKMDLLWEKCIPNSGVPQEEAMAPKAPPKVRRRRIF